MRSKRRTLSEPSVLLKTQRNHAVLLRRRFKTIDAEALNRHCRRFCIRRTVYHIYQGQWRK
jgi:hypothetical protein